MLLSGGRSHYVTGIYFSPISDVPHYSLSFLGPALCLVFEFEACFHLTLLPVRCSQLILTEFWIETSVLPFGSTRRLLTLPPVYDLNLVLPFSNPHQLTYIISQSSMSCQSMTPSSHWNYRDFPWSEMPAELPTFLPLQWVLLHRSRWWWCVLASYQYWAEHPIGLCLGTGGYTAFFIRQFAERSWNRFSGSKVGNDARMRSLPWIFLFPTILDLMGLIDLGGSSRALIFYITLGCRFSPIMGIGLFLFRLPFCL